MRKLLLWLLVLSISVTVVATFPLIGCKKEAIVEEEVIEEEPVEEVVEEEPAEEAEEEAVEEDGGYFVSSAVMTLQFPWFLGTVEGMENVVSEIDNVEFTWEDSQFDISTQIQQLENFAQMGVDGVVIYPVDGKAIIPTMVDLYNQGIKVVVADYPQSPDDPSDIVWETFVGHDFREMGKVSGEIAVEYLKTLDTDSPVCAWLTCPPSGQASIDRIEGFKEVVLAEFPNAVIIEQGDPTATRDSAQTVFENLLQVTPHIDVVCGHNDQFVLGAYGAATSQEREEIKFIGLAGTAEVLQYIQDGNPMWIGEVLQDPVVLGEASMTALIEALNGEDLPDRYPLMKPEGITSDNISGYDWQNWKWLGLE